VRGEPREWGGGGVVGVGGGVERGAGTSTLWGGIGGRGFGGLKSVLRGQKLPGPGGFRWGGSWDSCGRFWGVKVAWGDGWGVVVGLLRVWGALW